MINVMKAWPLECSIGVGLALVALWLWKAPTRAQMWAWLEFQASVNKQANELRERLRQGRKERIALEVER